MPWSRLVDSSCNLLEEYRVDQPYIQQAVDSGTAKQIAMGDLGPVMQYVATINGEQVVVQAVQLADGTIQITNAWRPKRDDSIHF